MGSEEGGRVARGLRGGAGSMQARSGRYFYFHEAWDARRWIDLIAIEYEALVGAFPFETRLRSISDGGRLRVLDVGCGTGIFPTFLDAVLPDDLHLQSDLLDISPASLVQARKALQQLKHFSPRRTYQVAIEDLPDVLPRSGEGYDVIWSIHAFTTVDLGRMPAVCAHLLELLAETGLFFIYQLTARSSYQRIHAFYREHHPDGETVPAYMQYEDTQRILEELGSDYEVLPLSFAHHVPEDRLQSYLQKCVLDPGLEAEAFFAPLLPSFHEPERGVYRFPQQVNLVIAPRPSMSA